MDLKDKLSEYRNLLNDLTSQRDILEIEADAINSELSSPTVSGGPPVGRSGPLTDAEGFPRADIDIYNIKSKRKRLAEINTDYKLLMKRIEGTVTEIYNIQQDISSNSDNSATLPTIFSFQDLTRTLKSESTSSSTTTKIIAIAIIDEVFEGSPTQLAGIQNGDELIDFGGVSANSDKEDRGYLSMVAKVVSGSVGQPIPVTVRRDSQLIQVTLTPQTWSGRGLLGCHLTPKL
eukprot:gene33918-43820_t